MPSGHMPFRRTLTAHAAYSVALQRHKLRSSLSFTKDDFDIQSEYDEKGTTTAWVAAQAQLVVPSSDPNCVPQAICNQLTSLGS